jgi:hypothetical protein
MTITEEMVSVLFDKGTLTNVKQQFKSGKEKIPINSENMNFRLFKSEHGNINLELLCQDSNGMYFKPLGFYEFEKGGFFSSGKLSLTILNEFVDDYKNLKNSNQISDNGINLIFMSIKESCLIAAFSRETIETIKIMYREKEIGVSKEAVAILGPFPHMHAMQFDKHIFSNGLKIDLLFSFDGSPQCFLDDEYKIDGAFGAYFKNANGFSLNPIVAYKSDFDKFSKMGLLTALNKF